jgi:hypothetical protein
MIRNICYENARRYLALPASERSKPTTAVQSGGKPALRRTK